MNSTRFFRGLCFCLLLAGGSSFLLSLRTGSPTGWQPIFLIGTALWAVAAGYMAVGFDEDRLLRVRHKLLWLRRHDALLFVTFFSLLLLTGVASALFYLAYLTYIAVTPVLLGGSLLLMITLGSSTRLREMLELVAKGFLALFSVVLALVVVDVGVSAYYRTIPYWADDSVSERAEQVGWRTRPNLNLKNGEFTTNSLGYRTPYEPEDIPSEAVVIGLQGDSQLEAFDIAADETFEVYLEQCLSEWGGISAPIRVVNFGVRGYDLNNYLSQSLIITEQYDLDWLVMLFNSRNDYDRAMLKAAYGAYRPFWVLEGNRLKQVTLPEPFALQIYPVEFQEAYADYTPFLKYENETHFSIDPDHPLAGSWLYIMLKRRLYDIRPPLAPTQTELDNNSFYLDGYWKYSDPIPEPFNAYRSVFEAILEEWQKQAPHTLIYILPDRREILWEEETQAQAEGIYQRMGKPAPIADYFLRWIEAVIEPLGIPTYNFYDRLRAQPNRAALFLTKDSHFSPEGYRIMAEAACEDFQQHLNQAQN